MAPQLQLVLFWLLAAAAVIAAVGVILSRNAIYSALALLVNFAVLAVLYVMLNAQFVAAVQVMVYAGAIVVLFLFVTMLLGYTGRAGPPVELFARRTVFVIAAALVFLTIVGSVLFEEPIGGAHGSASPDYIAQVGQTQAVGLALFTDYLLAFEVTGVLLLVGMIGTIVLAQRWHKASNQPKTPGKDN